MADESLIVSLTDQKSKFMRDALGQWISAQHVLTAANRRNADEVQKLVVDAIDKKIKRRAVSSHRLLQVTGLPGNATGINGQFKNGFQVGIPSFLDNSQAKYWRSIEEGTEVAWKKRSFIGLEITGLFSETLEGSGPYSQPGPDASRIGKVTPWSTVQRFGNPGMKKARIIVEREIEPQYAYTKAWNRFGRGRRIRGDLHELIASITSKSVR